MRLEDFQNGCFYHVYSRGVNKGLIFFDDLDRSRFCESLCLFNDATYMSSGNPLDRSFRLSILTGFEDRREPLVRLLAYCLMDNHFHLLVQQVLNHGVSKFMHKLQMGFVKYINLRHKRSGPLFEVPFKVQTIDRESQFEHIPRYIHLNALDREGIPWRDGVVSDWNLAWNCLEKYRWSSHMAYLAGEQEFPVVDMAAVEETMPDVLKNYPNYLRGWSQRSAVLLGISSPGDNN